MIYTVTEVATGKVVGASVVDWDLALSDALAAKRIRRDIVWQLEQSRHTWADGFALHGFRLGVRE